MTRTRPSRRARLVALVLPLAAVALPAAAGAQACLGNASFNAQPVRLGAALVTGGGMTTALAPVTGLDQTTLALDVNFGGPVGAFGGGGIGFTDFEDLDESAPTISGSIGYQIPIGTSVRGGAQICPIGSLGYTIGPDQGNTDTRFLNAAAGFALGVPVGLTPAVRLVPFGALGIRHQRVSVDAGSVDDSDSETGGMLDLGAGLTFNDRFTIRPAVNVPIGFEGADAGFSLGFALSFGGTR